MSFALLLFLLLVVTGILWCYETFVLRPKRVRDAQALIAEFDRVHAPMLRANGGDALVQKERAEREANALRQPAWVEYSASFFPVIAIVFFVRSFVVEPFKIPSGSMIPTLLVGDLILVNKYTYGVRLPIVHTKIIPMNDPQRGDVMVFRWPKDESLDYIKRVVGLPGDTIVYEGKRLTVNGQPVDTKPLGKYFDANQVSYSEQFEETLGAVTHRTLNDPDRPPYMTGIDNFPFRDQCSYSSAGLRCTVPAGHYLMMGDNRDNSSDSRVWGFVPERNIVGKAFVIWMNFSDLGRIGGFK